MAPPYPPMIRSAAAAVRWSMAGITRADQAFDGLVLDLAIYLASAGFAWLTWAHSTLSPHRAWGGPAGLGYLAAALGTLALIVARGRRRTTRSPAGGESAAESRQRLIRGRVVIATVAWLCVAVLPMLVQVEQRAAGTAGRAQEEVLVVEAAGTRLVHDGSPFLSRPMIGALPADDRLLAYVPYQPAMALFGLPRAVVSGEASAGELATGGSCFGDARLWFTLVATIAAGSALWLLRRGGSAPSPLRRDPPSTLGRDQAMRSSPRRGEGALSRAAAEPGLLIRAAQAIAVLPICALTVATGGDDVPVLALCLLALALSATGRFTGSGWAVGAAAALKLFAWPIAVVLAFFAAASGQLRRFAIGALILPVVTALPALIIDPRAVLENLIAFPAGRGLVASPAASPLPGHLLAGATPAGATLSLALLAGAGLALAYALIRRPPTTAAVSALIGAGGLLIALLLMPATRFGYLLYPTVLAVWAGALSLRPIGDAPDVG